MFLETQADGFAEAPGGWRYGLPVLSDTLLNIPSQNPNQPGYCSVDTSFVFTDSGSSREPLFLSLANVTVCGRMNVIPQTFYSATNDPFYTAWTQNGAVNDGVPFYVANASGTLYHFPYLAGYGCTGGNCNVPDYIEDRNGNKITITANPSTGFPLTVNDTVGRNLLSMSGFGTSGSTVTVSGDSAPYTLQWQNLTPHVSIATGPELSGSQYCGPFSEVQSGPGMTVISSLTLPNGRVYQFYYDATYGLLSKIVYPSGGYVSYSWGVNTQSDMVYWTDSMGNYPGCAARYSAPAILHRYVSYDGATVAQQQDFTYVTDWSSSTSTTWISKTTTVKTTDLLRLGNPVTYTVYNYVPTTIQDPPNIVSRVANQVPQENTTAYQDGTGSTLRTITKSWTGFLPNYQQTTLENGQTSRTNYFYGTLAVPTEQDEYDFGSGAPGALLRKTVSNYQTFPVTPLGTRIYDRPCQTLVYDSAGNRVAETDFLYDTGTTVCGTAPTPTLGGTGSYTGHDEALYGTTATVPRGNMTSKIARCFVGATSCPDAVTTYIYDETGQVLSMKDPCGNGSCSDMNVAGETHTTTYSYADSYTVLSNGQNVTYSPPGNTNAYLTGITYPTTVTSDYTGTHAVQHIENFQYDYNTGQLTVSKDQNNQPTTYIYNDPLARPTQVTYPDQGQTTITYNDSPPSPSVTTSRKIDTSGRLLTTVKVMDGLGHAVQTQLTTDPDGADYTDTTYDGSGRVYKRSNPHRSASLSTDGTTTYFYDALGRPCLVVPADATVPSSAGCPTSQPTDTVFTTYSGASTTVIDEAGKKRQVQTDAVGGLTQVVEDPGGRGYATTYSYDALYNLTSVTQNGSHLRSFSYDSLSRLTSATNPESGGLLYYYDLNGNVTGRIDARNIEIFYGYDALNRMRSKQYSDSTVPAAYYYDQSSVLNGISVSNPIGRLTSENTYSNGTYPDGSVFFGYDPMGRVLSYFQCVLNCATSGWAMYYTYDFLGDITSYTNGLGTTFTQSVDTAGRLSQISSSLSDPSHPATLATADATVGYWPNGGLRKVALGNGLTQTTAYNNRLQPCRMNVNSAGFRYTLCTDSPSGNVFDLSYGFNSGTADNGNVMSWSAVGTQAFSRTYSYDPLNRLGTMSAPGSTCSGLSWNYDAWGNRTDQNVTAGSCIPFHQQADGNNRLIGFGYDAAGNMTSDGSHTYYYDAENRIIQVDGTLGTCSTATACYIYDAEGKRVQKSAGAAQTIYLYDLSGHVINEVDGNNATLANYIYANGSLLAEYKNNSTFFVHEDHLGSSSLLTSMTGTVADCNAFYPFGGQDSTICASSNTTTRKFTGKERDTESGNDYFGARYYGSSMGRFLSPDPVIITPERLMNPQQLNLYAYVTNNPLRFIDPTGEILQCVGDDKSRSQCFADLQRIAGDAKDRLSMDAKTGVVSFDTKDLDMSKNEGAALVNNLVGSKNTYDFSVGPTIMTDKGPVRVDHIGLDMANLPAFGDQRQIGNPPAGVSDILDLYLNNPNMTRVSNTNLQVAPEWTVAFHELAEAFEKIDGGKGNSYAAGHNAALQREMTLRDQRPYLKQYNTGAGGPANSPNPQGGIIIKK